MTCLRGHCEPESGSRVHWSRGQLGTWFRGHGLAGQRVAWFRVQPGFPRQHWATVKALVHFQPESPWVLFSFTVTPILKYTGDYPSRQSWHSLELTDQMFSLALQDPALQDELYCQILKQLTHNSIRSAKG